MLAFDWIGAATFGYGSFSGFGRVGYSLLQTLTSCAILGLLGLIISVVIDIVHESKLEGFNKMAGNEISRANDKSKMSGAAMFFGFIFSVSAWIWTTSFSAACYEHWRGLEPVDQTQKMNESGNKPKTA